DSACVTFQSPDIPGALRESAARKAPGPVTENDLIEFAGERILNRPTQPVQSKYFQGIMVSDFQDGQL
ncbi:MAG TPA: hypothetical protein VGE41_10720, partial [Verrucomicrobiae bacterium]